MLIDSDQDYQLFLKENRSSDLIINVLEADTRFHAACNSVTALFFKNISTGKDYTIAVNHPDALFLIPHEVILKDINAFVGKKWVFDKKKTSHLLALNNLLDINIFRFLDNDTIYDISEYEPAVYNFYRRMYEQHADLNCVIPLSIHSALFETINDSVFQKLKNITFDDVFVRINEEMSVNLQRLESNGLKVDPVLFQQFFGDKNVKLKYNTVYTEYNLFTSTGRPSNRFKGINYAALKKDDGCRTSFVSRYGQDGYLFMIDYSAYHPHLIAELVRYDLPANVYNFLGQSYFSKDTLTDDELKQAKDITFQVMYGHIPDKYSDIPYFMKIKEYIAHRWDYFTKYGYVETPVYKRRITEYNIKDPNPNKLFNYILQASETEYNMQMLTVINQYLAGKLTKAVLYTYDAVLFDIHVSESDIRKNIRNLMSYGKFPVKCYQGLNYNEMNVIRIE